MSTTNSAATRPGRLVSSTIRSARRAASRTLWVTNRMVEPGLPPDALELVVHDVAGHGVEGAEGLVHQQDVGLLRQRPGQGDALAHAAGQLVGLLVDEAVEPHQLEQLERPGPCAGCGARLAAAAPARRSCPPRATGRARPPGT